MSGKIFLKVFILSGTSEDRNPKTIGGILIFRIISEKHYHFIDFFSLVKSSACWFGYFNVFRNAILRYIILLLLILVKFDEYNRKDHILTVNQKNIKILK